MVKRRQSLVSFRLPDEVMDTLERMAKEKKTSAHDVARTLVIEALFSDIESGVDKGTAMDKNVVKMICRNMCINQRLAVALLDGDMGVLQDAENDTNKILKQLGYEG